ncbi:MAG: hypothetical protein ACE5NJ_04595 [Thermodesulfobacteriota bacterium]
MLPSNKMTTLIIGLIVIAISLVACTKGLQGENVMPEKPIQEVLKEHTPELMSLPGVVGTAQGLCDDKPCIKVLVIEKTAELDQKIPGAIEGYPVMIEETGEIRALPKSQD